MCNTLSLMWFKNNISPFSFATTKYQDLVNYNRKLSIYITVLEPENPRSGNPVKLVYSKGANSYRKS